MTKKTGTAIALGVLAAAAALLWIAGGHALAAEAVYPAERAGTWWQRNVNLRLRTLWRRQNYAVANASLRRENDALKMALFSLTSAKPPAEAPRDWISAPVLSRGGVMGVRNRVRVGRGSLDGVTPGAAVAAPEGLVGRVSQVSPHTAVVTFITDPECRVSVQVETPGGEHGAVFGILSGGGAETVASADLSVLYVVNPLRVQHLKRDLVLPPRAKIVTSGLGGVFPRGLTVGFLTDETREDETRLERTGKVVPAVDFPALEDVFIRREN